MPTIENADILARTAHHGQTDKAGHPYINHVRAVAALLEPHGPHAVMAGLLHDVIEDTHITLNDLHELGFPQPVIAAVDAVTRRPGEPYMDMIARAAADPLGRLVKLADNAHNSDPARLALLGVEQRAWFEKKYAAARAVLEAATRTPKE